MISIALYKNSSNSYAKTNLKNKNKKGKETGKTRNQTKKREIRTNAETRYDSLTKNKKKEKVII